METDSDSSSLLILDERDLGDICCRSWPRTCADVQAQTPTFSKPCDFCLYGPPTPPVRPAGGMGLEEAMSRARETECARGRKLREAVISYVEGDES